MELKEMFVKPIDRNLTGVIKIGEESSTKQELEEYVVTRELQKHFAEFFDHYQKGIHNNIDEMGVWISGFFGSGKSHFLKILSYLLSDMVVDGKKPIDYFVEDKKITDEIVLGNMRAASQVTTDVILFNIDSKSDSTSKQTSKETILSVFLKVFNQHLGFYGGNHHIADLERTLAEEQLYEKFQDTFYQISGKSWVERRSKFRFIRDKVSEALVEIGFMEKEAAEHTCDSFTEDYTLTIEAFAELIQDYCKSKGKHHHILFMVDEMGQYIGDNRDLMLNLQTVTEDLGTHCKGKAWVMVTSQEDIDSITKVKGQDFSKIQGRFDTKLSLSSANVDEVIRKRVLEKTPEAQAFLYQLYEKKSATLKNLISFEEVPEQELYETQENFSAVYPFIPYQFKLLQSVLNSIRKHGASGKHLAEGERSMLALFKDSVTKKMREEEGILIPFHMFYDEVERFLDGEHKKVVIQAHDSAVLNPSKEASCFTVNVLKILFLIKYVKEMKATVSNITTLMIDHMDADRLVLEEQVKESLNLLVKQTLVLEHDGVYTFLSNQEQEINREINQIAVDSTEMTKELSSLLFDDIYTKKNYTTKYNPQPLDFVQMLDGVPFRNNNSGEFILSFLTPYCDENRDETSLKLKSSKENVAFVVLPEDSKFMDELRKAKQIEKYLVANSGGGTSVGKEQKREEMNQRKKNARFHLVEGLKQSDIYVGGDKLQEKTTDYAKKIEAGLARLVNDLYHKQTLMVENKTEADILACFQEEDDGKTVLDGTEKEVNHLAILEMEQFIARKSQGNGTTTMKQVLEVFSKSPYGFASTNIAWLVAKLLKRGDITMSKNAENITLRNKKHSEILDFLTIRKQQEQLVLATRQKAGEQEKKVAVDLLEKLFSQTAPDSSDDGIVASFKAGTERLLRDFKEWEDRYYSTGKPYPAKQTVQQGKQLLLQVSQCQSSGEFFKFLGEKKVVLGDLAEDLEDISEFFRGEQLKIWENNNRLLEIYKESENFISDVDLMTQADSLKKLQADNDPFGKISNMSKIQDTYRELYTNLLEKESKPVLDIVKQGKERVLDELKDCLCESELKGKVMEKFQELTDKAEKCNNIAHLKNIVSEADAVKNRLLNEISLKENGKIAEELAKKPVETTPVTASTEEEPVQTPVTPKKKTQRHVSVSKVTQSMTWRITSQEDLEDYLQKFRTELEKQLALSEDSVLNIEFQ